MPSLISAKQVLLGYDITKPYDPTGKVNRGTAHEFQDYAYRLAENLNDLGHLQIYMSLSKKYPKYLLDRVYEFVADINEDNRGKLFMWKFKNLRQEFDFERNKNNFDYDYVLKNLKNLRENLSSQIIKKYSNLAENKIIQFLEFNTNILDSKSKILVYGCISEPLVDYFLQKDVKVEFLDISKNIISHFKTKYSKFKNLKFISKEILKKNLKNECYDLVVFNKSWGLIPLKLEEDILKKMLSSLKQGKNLILSTKIKDEESELWRNYDENKNKIYEKFNERKNLEAKFNKFLLNIVNDYSTPEETIYMLSK